MIKEKWKEVENLPKYFISNFGNVRSIKRKYEIIMKPSFVNNKYTILTLSKPGEKRKRYLVHRLVAKAFISNPGGKLQVNHIDGNTKNNRVENLEWCTKSENLKHAYIHLGRKPPMLGKKGKFNPLSKPVYQHSRNGDLIKRWDSIMDAKRDGFSSGHISNCCNKKVNFKTHKGFIWSYNS